MSLTCGNGTSMARKMWPTPLTVPVRKAARLVLGLHLEMMSVICSQSSVCQTINVDAVIRSGRTQGVLRVRLSCKYAPLSSVRRL